jgi:hypothetical protein
MPLKAWTLWAVICVAACQPAPRLPPPRPAGVPSDAVWVGGVDGGDWLRCVFRGKDPAIYDCDVYSDQTGRLTASGMYTLVRCDPAGRCQPVTSLKSRTDYRAYDGVTIHLREPYALVPDGEIDHPFGDGHGKRVTYELGREVGPERLY